MENILDQIRTRLNEIAPNPKVRKRLFTAIVILLVLQLYFVRELIAAELLFGLGFAVLLVLVGIFYVVGAVGERVIDATQTGARAVVHSAHEGYVKASPVLEVAAQRSLAFAERSAKVTFEVSHRVYEKSSPVVEAGAKRAFAFAEAAARKISQAVRRGYEEASPFLESAADRGLVLAMAAGKFLFRVVRRGYHKLEELSKRPFRHPRSESAQ